MTKGEDSGMTKGEDSEYSAVKEFPVASPITLGETEQRAAGTCFSVDQT